METTWKNTASGSVKTRALKVNAVPPRPVETRFPHHAFAAPFGDAHMRKRKITQLKTIVALTPPGPVRFVLKGALAEEQAAIAALDMDAPDEHAPHEIVVTPDTTPEKALQIAYLTGRDLRAAGTSMEEFVMYLNQRILNAYSGADVLPFLRVGFAAGYFRKPMPDAKRIAARVPAPGEPAKKRGRKPGSAVPA